MTRTASLLVVCSLVSLAVDAAEFEWRRTDSTVSLLTRQQVVWQFNHGSDHPKPCFHPVALPGGPTLTWFRPDDHPWHRALWFSWKFINGVNYWEEDRDTGQSAGRTRTVSTKVETRPDFSARIAQELHYQPGASDPVLTESRTIETHPPDADGSYRMDWTMVFQAAQDVVLDRTPLPDEPGGQVYGGYAGLSVRLVEELNDREVITTDGKVSFVSNRFRGKSTGLDYTGTLDGKAVGVAIVDHPDNLNAPSPWYAINDPLMHFFSPAVICYGPKALKAGESFTLRYRVIIHPDRWAPDQLEAEAQRFGEEE